MAFEINLESVASNLYAAYQSGDFTDVSIQVGNQTFRAHRLVLTTNSDYFASALSGRFGTTESLKLVEVDPELVHAVLPTFYGNCYHLINWLKVPIWTKFLELCKFLLFLGVRHLALPGAKKDQALIDQVAVWLAKAGGSVERNVIALTTFWSAPYSGPLVMKIAESVQDCLEYGEYCEKMRVRLADPQIRQAVLKVLRPNLRTLFVKAHEIPKDTAELEIAGTIYTPEFLTEIGFASTHLTEKEWDLHRKAGFINAELSIFHKHQFIHVAAFLTSITRTRHLLDRQKDNGPMTVILTRDESNFECYVIGHVPPHKYGNWAEFLGPINIFETTLNIDLDSDEINENGTYIDHQDNSKKLSASLGGVNTFVATLTDYYMLQMTEPNKKYDLTILACQIVVDGMLRKFKCRDAVWEHAFN